MDIIYRRTPHLPAPAYHLPPEVILAIRRRLEPGATRRRGVDRCTECISRQGSGGEYDWIGCWNWEGKLCAACLAYECCPKNSRRECRYVQVEADIEREGEHECPDSENVGGNSNGRGSGGNGNDPSSASNVVSQDDDYEIIYIGESGPKVRRRPAARAFSLSHQAKNTGGGRVARVVKKEPGVDETQARSSCADCAQANS